MKKVSMVLLAILFSASMASAESFEVKAFNWGTIANGGKSKVEAYTRTFTDAKDPTFTANRLNKDVSANIINTRVIGADATMLVKVDIDCVDCADKFYDQVDVQADNKGDIFSKTDTFSTVGMVEENTIGNVAIGSNAGGLYTNTRVNAPSNTDPVRDATFNILSTNHGFDNNGDRTIVEATAITFTTYERLGPGTANEADYEGEGVFDNEISNTAIGANSFMDVEVDIDCDCNGKFYTDVTMRSENWGDVLATADTWSKVGHVNDNTIRNTAIGASSSGSYKNLNNHVAN